MHSEFIDLHYFQSTSLSFLCIPFIISLPDCGEGRTWTDTGKFFKVLSCLKQQTHKNNAFKTHGPAFYTLACSLWGTIDSIHIMIISSEDSHPNLILESHIWGSGGEFCQNGRKI